MEWMSENACSGYKPSGSTGVATPFMLMGYFNPIMAYGVNRFVSEASQAGAQGFIIPDLPPEEAEEMIAEVEKSDLAMAFLLAPNSPIDRIKTVTESSRGFVYLVSVTGITGTRKTLPPGLERFINRVRQESVKPIPLAVGFGISTPDQAGKTGRMADGVIIGSALISRIRAAIEDHTDPVQAVRTYIKDLREGLDTVIDH